MRNVVAPQPQLVTPLNLTHIAPAASAQTTPVSLCPSSAASFQALTPPCGTTALPLRLDVAAPPAAPSVHPLAAKLAALPRAAQPATIIAQRMVVNTQVAAQPAQFVYVTTTHGLVAMPVTPVVSTPSTTTTASPSSPGVGSVAFHPLTVGTPTMVQPGVSAADDARARCAQTQNATLKNTPSTSPAFVWDGWLYPAGLNRKERRAIMFAQDKRPQVNPRKLNERRWVGTDVPNGPVGDAGAAVGSAALLTPGSGEAPSPNTSFMDDDEAMSDAGDDCLPPLMDGDEY